MSAWRFLQAASTILAVIFLFLVISFTTVFASEYTAYTVSTNVGNPPQSTAPQNIPPNMNNCNGEYTYDLSNPDGHPFTIQNFGDPICDYTKDKLSTYIQQLDSKYWVIWYTVIVPVESSYDPNIIEHHCLKTTCAWGLYQMSKTGDGNNQYDQGDVYWKLQTYNAIHENILLNGISGSCGALQGQYCTHQTWCYWNSANAAATPILCHPL